MKKIIGSEVCIFLKGKDADIPDVYGLLIDVSEESLYVQGTVDDPRVYIIPKINVNFCTTDCLPASNRVISTTANVETETKPNSYDLSVYVNNELVSIIPVPPTFDMTKWHDGIMRVMLGNPDVKRALEGKVQKAINYYPGKVYIDVEGERLTQPPTSFSMGADIINNYLSPVEMAARLSIKERGENNGES